MGSLAPVPGPPSAVRVVAGPRRRFPARSLRIRPLAAAKGQQREASGETLPSADASPAGQEALSNRGARRLGHANSSQEPGHSPAPVGPEDDVYDGTASATVSRSCARLDVGGRDPLGVYWCGHWAFPVRGLDFDSGSGHRTSGTRPHTSPMGGAGCWTGECEATITDQGLRYG